MTSDIGKCHGGGQSFARKAVKDIEGQGLEAIPPW